MSKDKETEVVVPEVVEDKVTKDIARREDNAQRTTIKKAIGRQVAVIQGVELRGNFEKLKLGAMVSEAARLLKIEDGASRGPTAKGGGALGWWEDVCPRDKDGKPVIAYKTVMQWKEAAERIPFLLNRIAANDPKVPDTWKPEPHDKVIALLAKNPKKAIGKDKSILESAEKMANGMTMRQMLLWGGDEEPSAKGKKASPGAPKAKCKWCDEKGMCTNKKSQCKGLPCPNRRCDMFEREAYAKTAEDRIAEAEEQTRELMGKIGAYFRGKWFETVSEQTKNDFIRSLKDWAEVASERM